MNLPGSLSEPALVVYDYLAETDPLPALPCDAVLGFGTFDLRVARFCGDLHVYGHAENIIFTGGVGAGTADLVQPEADAWWQELLIAYPSIDPRRVVRENQSTNTAENISFTAQRIAQDYPDLVFGQGVRSVIMVASPSRMRRAWLTLRQMEPGITIFRQLPCTNLKEEYALYESKGLRYLAHLMGELDRIEKYSELGWIVSTELPANVQVARRELSDFVSSGLC